MEVQIYTTPVCPWCKKVKDWLKKKKVSFIEHDVSESDKARDDMIEKSGQMAVPVIDIDGKIIVGFNEQKLEDALKKSK
ncbi:NrdH-redoxin [Candidatus Woesearchaeota archaeon CG_4_10_14_0_2_um_filter_33_13]|nr:MAG: NrdH-redoxin [Candidatus Woesearchaeota archaeon CG_4_10_14_0_2_um_filter_33_13]